MRPLSVLLGIITGSCTAIAVSLSMSGAVFLLLPAGNAQVQAESRPLLAGIVLAWALVALAGAAFVGELRATRWRRWPQALLLVALAVLAWRYWPK